MGRILVFLGLGLLLACGGEPSSDTQVPDTPSYIFEPIDSGTEQDVTTHRLCVDSGDPDQAPDPVYIDCMVETWVNPDVLPSVNENPVVLTYNIERGHKLDDQIALFMAGDLAPVPDIILMSEADRGCSRTGYRHTALEYAKALGMHMVYATEFVEISGSVNGDPSTYSACEHGNAILSRYPLGNAGAMRHRENVSWYTPVDERGSGGFSTRLGGRVTVFADTKIQDSYMHLYSLHFSSDFGSSDVRASQAEEIVEHASDYQHPVLVAGDTNAFFYAADVSAGVQTDDVTGAFLTNGYTDAHSGLAYENRYTCEGQLDSQPIIDLIFGKSVEFTNSAICHDTLCRGLSDHYPVWTTIVW